MRMGLKRETKVRDEDGIAREGKLYPKATGPFKILDRRSHVVVLEMEGEREMVSLDRVTLAPVPPGVEVPEAPQPDVIQGGEVPATDNDLLDLVDPPEEEGDEVQSGDPADVTPRAPTGPGSDSRSEEAREAEAPTGDDPALEDTPTPRPFSRFRRSAPREYVYEKLIGYDPERGYKVRWYGYGPEADTWEPLEHLPRNLVARYHRKHNLPAIALS